MFDLRLRQCAEEAQTYLGALKLAEREVQELQKALLKIANHPLGHDSHNQLGERELCRACTARRAVGYLDEEP